MRYNIRYTFILSDWKDDFSLFTAITISNQATNQNYTRKKKIQIQMLGGYTCSSDLGPDFYDQIVE